MPVTVLTGWSQLRLTRKNPGQFLFPLVYSCKSCRTADTTRQWPVLRYQRYSVIFKDFTDATPANSHFLVFPSVFTSHKAPGSLRVLTEAMYSETGIGRLGGGVAGSELPNFCSGFSHSYSQGSWGSCPLPLTCTDTAGLSFPCLGWCLQPQTQRPVERQETDGE